MAMMGCNRAYKQTNSSNWYIIWKNYADCNRTFYVFFDTLVWQASCINRDGGGICYPPLSCQFLKLKHHIHSHFEKGIIIERAIQFIKYRTESFDVYFLCSRRKKYKLKHVRKWLNLFAYYYNRGISA